jgi:ATP/maltotriose-dependent transcriptional regulator MalT
MKWFLPQKVIRPYAPASVSARPRLQGRILPNLDRKLTLMVAPAGYGKTVLALELTRQSEHLDCWYELDEHDAHLEVFYTYLCEAIRQRVPDFLERLPERPQEATPWELAGLLTATLYGLPEPLLLVLSNFHKVSDSEEVTSFVDTLVTYLPPTCHLLLLSRNQTRLNLARLVANQEVNLLTQGQLAFDLAEAETVAAALGCSDQARVIDLHTRLGGWPAGFTLLLGHGEPQEQGGGAEALVYAYLSSEVLGELSEREQRFAYLTALLAPFSEDELSAYCAPEERTLLERFAKRHAILFATTQAGRREPLYDYQPLVKEFLKETLARNHVELWRELNLRVGVQRFDEGQLDALENLVNAGAVAAIVERLEVLRRSLRESGDYSHFALWLRRLPEDALKDHPELLILMAEALVQRDALAARELYERALELGVGERPLRAAALSGLLRAEHNLRRYRDLLGRAPGVLSELRETRQLRELAFSYNSVARAHMSLGQFAEAKTAFEFVGRVGEELSDTYFEALATRGLASYADYVGDVQRALLLNQRTLSYWEARANSYQIASTLNNIATCHLYLGDLHEGLACGLRALSLWNELSTEESPVLLHCTLGDLQLALGNEQSAETHYSFASSHSPSDAFSHTYALLGLARLYSLGQQRAKAERYVQHALELSLTHGFKFNEGLAQLLSAQLGGRDAPLAAAERIFSDIGAKRELTQVFWLRSEGAGDGARRYAERARAAEAELGYRSRPLPACGPRR